MIAEERDHTLEPGKPAIVAEACRNNGRQLELDDPAAVGVLLQRRTTRILSPVSLPSLH